MSSFTTLTPHLLNIRIAQSQHQPQSNVSFRIKKLHIRKNKYAASTTLYSAIDPDHSIIYDQQIEINSHPDSYNVDQT